MKNHTTSELTLQKRKPLHKPMGKLHKEKNNYLEYSLVAIAATENF